MKDKINSKKALKTDTMFFLLVLFLSAVLFFIFNYKTVLYSDDFLFSASHVTGERITTVGEAIESFKYFCLYERANVRLASLLSMIYSIPDKMIFNIINTIIYIGLNVALYYNAFGFRKKLKPLGIAFAFALVFLLVPAYGQSILWVTGSANYLCASVAMLLFIIPYRNYYVNTDTQTKQSSKLKGILFTVFMFVYAFFAAWIHEQTALIMVVASAVFIIGYKLKGVKLRVWMFSGAISSLCGFILVTLGSLRRLEDESANSGNLIAMIVKNFAMITIKLFYYLTPIILLMLGIVLFLHFKSKKNISKEYILNALKDNMHIVAYILGGLASCYSMVIVPIFAIRAWCAPVIMFILVFLALLDKLIDNLGDKKELNKACSIITLALMLCFICSSIIEYSRVADVAEQYNTREAYILDQKAKGNLDIEVPAINAISKYDLYYYADAFDVGENSNTFMSKYYGVNTITEGEYITE
ncbi:MAG: hypothetical protein II233_03360 [Clostridia bacterium]|nr:hypothetical protein [Clostridia bacterium]